MSRSVRGSSAGMQLSTVPAAWQGRERNFERDAAIEAAAFFGVFIAQRLRGADAARKHTGGLHAIAQQRGANLVGALRG